MATRRSFWWPSLVACVVAFFAVKAAAAEWGDLRGRFLYDGEPPALKFITPDKDVEVAPKVIPDERLLVHRDSKVTCSYRCWAHI